MTDQDFDFICRLLRERSGIALEPGKEYLVESRLLPLAKELNLGSIAGLVQQLRTGAANGLSTRVVEAMVTTETSFFRDHHPFESLRTKVIPELMKRRQAERSLSIWCAATSSGQEPYSVAMLLKESFPELATWKVTLLATDVSQQMLTRAREGCYNQIEVNRGLPATHLVKYFEREGSRWLLRPAVRNLVEFRELNLCKPWPPLPPMDLVLLRNVMIYFEVDMKKVILGKIGRVLRPDGYLLLGGAETTFNLDDSYERVEEWKAGFFRRSR